MSNRKRASLTTMETALSAYREWTKSEEKVLQLLSDRSWTILKVAAKVYGVHPRSLRAGKETPLKFKRNPEDIVDDVLGEYAFARLTGEKRVVGMDVSHVVFSVVGAGGRTFRVPTSILLEDNVRVLASDVRKKLWKIKNDESSKREDEIQKLEKEERELSQKLFKVRAKTRSLRKASLGGIG